jgi:capsular exopolysaccharide synthesis family protein
MSSMTKVMQKIHADAPEAERLVMPEDADAPMAPSSVAPVEGDAPVAPGPVAMAEGDAPVAPGPVTLNEVDAPETANSTELGDFAASATTNAAVSDDANAIAASDPAAPSEAAAPAAPTPASPTEAPPATASAFVAENEAVPRTPPAPVLAAQPPRTSTTAWDPLRVDPAIVAFHDRYSAICEQFRSVRARLLTMNTGRTHLVIAVTSAIPQEGKSVAALNLGLVMAEGGEHRILVVDTDFRRASLATLLGLPEQPGLAELLRDEVALTDALQPTPLPNLQLLLAGQAHDHACGELLGRSSAGALWPQLREAFDYTFLDTPPITTVSDVCLLAPHSDGAIIVIEMHRTPEPTAQQAVRTLQANNVRILGCILSRFRERAAGYYERHYPSYYQG